MELGPFCMHIIAEIQFSRYISSSEPKAHKVSL